MIVVRRTVHLTPRVTCAMGTMTARTAMRSSSTACDREIEPYLAPESSAWRGSFSSQAGGSSFTATSHRGDALAQESPLISMAFEEQDDSSVQERPAGTLTDLRPLYENSTRGLECGDLRLGQFMEEVKTELWQYNAMPFRKRFRVQSLLRCDILTATSSTNYCLLP